MEPQGYVHRVLTVKVAIRENIRVSMGWNSRQGWDVAEEVRFESHDPGNCTLLMLLQKSLD